MQSHTNGFTLIETVMYIGLLSLLITFSIGITYQILDGSDRVTNATVREAEALFLLRKINWLLNDVSSVNLPVVGTSSTSLSLNKVTGGSLNPFIFSLVGQNAQLRYGTSSVALLNNQSVIVNTLSFQHIPRNGNTPPAIGVTLTVNNRPFQTTIYLRNL